jgi:hypothetical protein
MAAHGNHAAAPHVVRREKGWRSMGRWREWINNNSATVTIGAVVALVVALGVWYWQQRPTREAIVVRQVYFYDLDKGELLTLPRDQVPPARTKSGEGKGVRAYVYSCGECTKEQMFIGYLERYPDDARQELLSRRANPQANSPSGRSIEELEDTRLVAAEEDAKDPAKWFALNTPEAVEIRNYFRTKCKDEAKEKKIADPPSPRACNPD